MQSDFQIDQELLYFARSMVHDLGHLVAVLRSHIDRLERSREVREHRAWKEVRDVSRVADQIADWLRTSRFLFSEEYPAPCDFVSDVLQPAVSMAGLVSLQAHLLVDKSARDVPRVEVRPGPAVWGLTILLKTIASPAMRCKAVRAKDTFTFRISAELAIKSLDAEMKKRFTELEQHVTVVLEAAGIAAELSRGDRVYTIALRAKVARQP